jgi:hypothetical protein
MQFLTYETRRFTTTFISYLRSILNVAFIYVYVSQVVFSFKWSRYEGGPDIKGTSVYYMWLSPAYIGMLGRENLRGLSLVAVKRTTVQVFSLLL